MAYDFRGNLIRNHLSERNRDETGIGLNGAVGEHRGKRGVEVNFGSLRAQNNLAIPSSPLSENSHMPDRLTIEGITRPLGREDPADPLEFSRGKLPRVFFRIHLRSASWRGGWRRSP